MKLTCVLSVIFAYFSSVFNGFFSWIVGRIPESAPLARWQYLYLITGTVNITYSIFLLFFLPDTPMNARFLTESEKYYATQRLAENRTGIADKAQWKWSQAREALLDVKVWLIFFFNIAINIPNGGLLTFGSIIIKNLGLMPCSLVCSRCPLVCSQHSAHGSSASLRQSGTTDALLWRPLHSFFLYLERLLFMVFRGLWFLSKCLVFTSCTYTGVS